MKQEYCARVYVHAVDDAVADCCVDETGRPFRGLADVRTAICDRMRTMIAEEPARNWRQCRWVAQLHIYAGPQPGLDHLLEEFDLAVRYYDGREPDSLPEEQYICFAPGAAWHTDSGPGDIAGALGDCRDPWLALAVVGEACGRGDGLSVAWLDRHSGRFEYFDIELRTTPSSTPRPARTTLLQPA